jgi:hypothetical protein
MQLRLTGDSDSDTTATHFFFNWDTTPSELTVSRHEPCRPTLRFSAHPPMQLTLTGDSDARAHKVHLPFELTVSRHEPCQLTIRFHHTHCAHDPDYHR